MATYPVSKPIPGMGLLGVASVLGEFDLSLPLEGVAGLPLGYALQVKDWPSFPGTPEFQGQARETALQRVRGKDSQKVNILCAGKSLYNDIAEISRLAAHAPLRGNLTLVNILRH